MTELRIMITYIRARLPTTLILWSDMLPRKTWRNAKSHKAAEKARKLLQRRARAEVGKEHGAVIRHCITEAHLCSDGVHLSDEGQERFLLDFELGIAQALGYSAI